jgi:hypothetical protein
MGLFDSDCPGHETYAIALVTRDNCDPESGLYRELQYPNDKEKRSDIRRLACGCECGWRSSHFAPSVVAPPMWGPFSPFLCKRDEDRIHELGCAHLDERKRNRSEVRR